MDLTLTLSLKLVKIRKPCADGVRSGHCNITISRGPGFDPRTRQGKEVPMNTLVCSCGSFVELSSAFRSLSGDNLAMASHPRMGQRHIFS